VRLNHKSQEHNLTAQTKFHAVATRTRSQVTQAHSPKFQPLHRRRAVPSATEREEQMMKEIKPFKVFLTVLIFFFSIDLCTLNFKKDNICIVWGAIYGWVVNP
jgi:hypothetical protein